MSDKERIYPRWKYHKTHAARIVKTPEHEERLGEDWKDSPADFGVVTCPSREQDDEKRLGFNPEDVAKEEPVEEAVEEEQSNVPRRRGR